MKKNIFKNTFYTVAITISLAVATLVVAGKYGIVGVRALVVQSGSMEPNISVGSVVFTHPTQQNYHPNDIITFAHSGRKNVLVTHRVVEVKKVGSTTSFVTKGDANEEADGEQVPVKDVVGKVIFSVPVIGRVISFSQTQLGFILLIIIPSVAIIYSELLNIKKQLAEYFRVKRNKKLLRQFR